MRGICIVRLTMPFKDKAWQNNFWYLHIFKGVLLSRGSKVVRELAEKTTFYTMYGIGEYTFAPYKVVWKRMASDLEAAVLSTVKTPIGEKDAIPTDTTSLIPFTSEEEAHYVCAILNFSPVRFCVRSYSSAGRGFGVPSIVKHFRIPKYVKGNESHQEISELSKNAHALAKRYYEQKDLEAQEELKEVEGEIDKIVAELYGITDEELEEVRKALRVLKGEIVKR